MLELRQARSEATTKLTESKARASSSFETPARSGVGQKAVQVLYENQCARNKTDWMTTTNTAIRVLNLYVSPSLLDEL